MADTPASDHSPSWQALFSCLQALPQGPWKMILLRNGELGERAMDGDDIDLLGSRAAVLALLETAAAWVRDGKCHLRVKATAGRKIGVRLFSTDGRHVVKMDLWTGLRQIQDRTRTLTYDACAAAVLNPAETIQRLPLPVEAAIFLHHLVSKRKNIRDPKQLARLAAYAQACRDAGESALAQALDRTAAQRQVAPQDALLALRLLERQLAIPPPSPCRTLATRLGDAIARCWLIPPASERIVAVMGFTQSGKSTLIRRLHAQRGNLRVLNTRAPAVAAPLAYLVFCARLRAALLRTRRDRLLLVEGSPVDTLLRPSGTPPRWSGWRWLTRLCGVRTPHIHLIRPAPLPATALPQAEACYDTEMFRYFSGRSPTDYLLFQNSDTPEAAADALGRIIERLYL